MIHFFDFYGTPARLHVVVCLDKAVSLIKLFDDDDVCCVDDAFVNVCGSLCRGIPTTHSAAKGAPFLDPVETQVGVYSVRDHHIMLQTQ